MSISNDKRTTRRAFLRMAVGTLVMIPLAGCAASTTTSTPVPPAATPTPTPPEPTKAPVTLQFWTSRPEDISVYKEHILPVFQDAHPHIKIEMTGYPLANYFQALNAALSAGEGPDIFYTNYAVEIIPYAKAGQVMDLKGKIHVDKLDPAAVAGVGRDVDGTNSLPR